MISCMSNWITKWEVSGVVDERNRKMLYAGLAKFPQMTYPQLMVYYEKTECQSPFFQTTPEELADMVGICKDYGITIVPAAGNGNHYKGEFSLCFEFRGYNEKARDFWDDIIEPRLLMQRMMEVS